MEYNLTQILDAYVFGLNYYFSLGYKDTRIFDDIFNKLNNGIPIARDDGYINIIVDKIKVVY